MRLGGRIWRWAVQLFPVRARRYVDEIGRRAWDTLGGYLRGVAFVPLVGAFVAALIVLAAIIVIQRLEGDLLYPLVVGRALEIHPVGILLALTAGGVLGGVIGAFLAVPAAAVANSAASYLRSRSPPRAPP